MTDHQSVPLEPDFAGIIDAAKGSGLPELNTLTPDAARAQYADSVALIAGISPDVANVEDLHIETPETTLPARLYRPHDAAAEVAALLVFFHGGGWSFGSIETHDHICRHLAAAFGGSVLSVEYRLAPEHKFPAAVEDAVNATQWASDNAHMLGTDPAKLFLGGDSAGGNLAAVAAIGARDAGGPAIAGQLLIYPATDMSMRFPSHTTFGDNFRLTRPLMVWSALNYLRDGSDVTDPRASPLLAESHAGLPPAIIITAGYDPLRDEGKAYADALRKAGVLVDYKCYPGAIHGFIGMTGVSQTAGDSLAFAGAALRAAVHGQTGVNE